MIPEIMVTLICSIIGIWYSFVDLLTCLDNLEYNFILYLIDI